ncbi:MAG TPA: DUF4331 family protein [Bryobacteraceae bacterium]|nr:DUF4331 family protein [Bryobacteraceae bacterium]
MHRKFSPGPLVLLAALFCSAAWFTSSPARAADHRDSPVVDGAPEGDITDVFAFLDPNDKSRMVFAMGVNPFAVAAVPTSYRFSTGFLYQFKIDTTGDAVEDFAIQVTFRDTAPRTPAGQMIHVRVGPANTGNTGAINTVMQDAPINVTGAVNTVLSNGGVQVFAGLRDDPFTFDVGQFFRIQAGTSQLFRAVPTSPIGPLTGRPIDKSGMSGIDSFSGFNASYIIVSVPLSALSSGAKGSIYNVWGTVSAPYVDDSYVQFERMGQPVFNTVFIPSAMKDAFNAGVPADDVTRWSSFVPDALTTTDNDGTGNTISGRAALLTALGVTSAPYGAPLLLPPTFPNTSKDLLRGALLPDVLRIDTNADPLDLGIGQIGLTNGRRPSDDVIDIALRVLRQLADVNFPSALAVPGSGQPRPGALTFGDYRVQVVLQGTDFIGPDSSLTDLAHNNNDATFLPTFPFFAPPHPRPGDSQ